MTELFSWEHLPLGFINDVKAAFGTDAPIVGYLERGEMRKVGPELLRVNQEDVARIPAAFDNPDDPKSLQFLLVDAPRRRELTDTYLKALKKFKNRTRC